ncbi:MAG: hypothetical protein KA140_04140 [Caldisericia bacterium]|nr:hypothetical protein [Caldisericia bacterium]
MAEGENYPQIFIDGLHLMPYFSIVGDKVAINTFHNVTFDDGRESEFVDNVYLLDLDDGEMELLNVPGSVKCVGYKDQLYLVIDNKKVVKYNIKSKSLDGELFDITKKIENGYCMVQQNISWFKFLDNKNHYENFLFNPNTMDICQSNVSFTDDWDYLYNDYFLACMRKNGKIVGIDTQSFKETWFISTNKLSKFNKVILGDERGILIQSDGKLICFGPPDNTGNSQTKR